MALSFFHIIGGVLGVSQLTLVLRSMDTSWVAGQLVKIPQFNIQNVSEGVVHDHARGTSGNSSSPCTLEDWVRREDVNYQQRNMG